MGTFTHFIVKQDWKKLFVFLLIAWLGMNFFQALSTEVMSDEAYYFLYGQNLAWGYFDHPPMVGLMTYLSDLLFNGNLSVRFATIFVQFFTLVLIWKLIEEKEPDSKKIALFFVISMSMIMFQAYGFVTAPDVPFLFFTTLFLLVYRNFLKEESWLNTLFLAFAMAGMIYSKYHAVLIIGCIVVSNFRLLIRYKFWIAGLLAVLLLTPHVYWQISMDFPSFKYHLSDRSSSFKWGYFLEYLPNQLVVFNPLTFGAVVYVFIKYRAKDAFERGLYFLTIGFVSFFWLMSFRGHVEPHWTVACTVPMIVLLYRRALHDKKLACFVKKGIFPSLFLIFAIRIILVMGLLPERLGFSGKKERNEAIESVAGNLPVVFTGSFQSPSNYHFFTGKESFVLSALDGRQTQFDIWQKELNYQGKPVFICQKQEGRSKEYNINGKIFHGYPATHFQSVNRVKIDYTLKQSEDYLFPNDTLKIDFKMSNPTSVDIHFQHAEFPVICKAVYVGGSGMKDVFYNCELEEKIEILPANTTISGSLKTVVPDLNVMYCSFALTLDNGICSAKNSDFIQLKIVK